jgi:site-specific recombinase XerD
VTDVNIMVRVMLSVKAHHKTFFRQVMLTTSVLAWHHVDMARRPTAQSAPSQRRTPHRSPTARRQAVQAAVADAWVAQQRTPNTRLAYRSDLDAFGRWCVQRGSMPLHVDADTLVAFESARQAVGDSPATIRRRWAALASFYRFALDHDAIDVNPVDAVDRAAPRAPGPSPIEVLTGSSVDAYLAAAAALDPRLEALVALLVFDGLKLGEALAVDVDDLTGRPPKVSLVLRRRGEQQRIELTQTGGRAVHRCAGRRHGEPLFVSAQPGRRSLSPQRLTRFGADHLIRQLTAPGDERVTSNALRRFHLAASAAADARGLRPDIPHRTTRSRR